MSVLAVIVFTLAMTACSPKKADDPQAAAAPQSPTETVTPQTQDSLESVDLTAAQTQVPLDSPSTDSAAAGTYSTAEDFRISGTELTRYTGNAVIVTIPDSVTELGERAFPPGISNSNSHLIEVLNIPASVTEIGYDHTWGYFALEGLIGLTEINVDPANREFSSIDGVLYDKSGEILLYVPNSRTGAFTVADTVTTIGYITERRTRFHAFANCPGITSITIPSSVTEIGESAFAATGITDIVIPSSVTEIGFFAFGYCSSLASITIPSSVTRINDSMFSHCGSLASITIPSSVTHIGNRVFEGCESLKSLIIPASVTAISGDAFENSHFTSVTFEGEISPMRFDSPISRSHTFSEDLRNKYLEGGPGTYTTSNPGKDAVWTKQ